MTTSRAALLPLTSTMHHERGVRDLTLAWLEAQLRLLRATGHTQLVLIAEEAGANDARVLVNRLSDTADVVLAIGGAEAAEALMDAEPDVTLLGHGVLLSRTCLTRLSAGPPILACRTPARDWERIDAERHWAGVLRCSANSARQSLASLGDWDVQATILRRAVQDGIGRSDVQACDCAHAFDDPNSPAFLTRERAARMSGGPRLLSRPLDRITERWAESLADRLPDATGPLLALGFLVVCSLAAALFDRPILLTGLLPVIAVLGGVAVASLRLSDRGPLTALALMLAAVVVGPLLAIAAGGAGWLGLAGGMAGLLSTGLLFVVYRGPGPMQGLEMAQAGLLVGTVLIGLPLALTIVALGALLMLLLHPLSRRRIARAWRAWKA